MAHDEEVKDLLKKLVRLLTKEENLSKQHKWVSSKEVFAVTIWTDKEKLRTAKNKLLITQYKDKNNHIWYDLNSVAPEFKKQKIA